MMIIAEIGVNHNGSLDLAKKIMEVAAAAGANAVKFQYYDAERLEPEGEMRATLKECELSTGDLVELKQEALNLDLEFGVTPFGVPEAEFLIHELQPNFIKLASGFWYNPDLVTTCKGYDQLFISTGGASLGDIANWIEFLDPDVIMHCVSAYPPPFSDMNMRVLETYGNAWLGTETGFSDHSQTGSTVAAVAAVCYGAEVIERHIMLDPNCVDAPVSDGPLDFVHYVKQIAAATLVKGSWRKTIQESEMPTVQKFKDRYTWRMEHG